MKQRMTIWGIGPKLISTALACFILTSSLTSTFPDVFSIDFVPKIVSICIGSLLLAIGIMFLISTQIVFIREFGKGKLISTGTYSICRNPIYATFILFIIPSLAILTNSWLSVTTSIVMYIVFKSNISKEYDCLRETFGEEYINYEKRVNEILPIPKMFKHVEK